MNRYIYKFRAAVLATFGTAISFGCWLIISKLTPKPSVKGWYKEVWYYGPLGFALLGLIIGTGMALAGLVAVAVNMLKEHRSYSVVTRIHHPAGRDYIPS